MNREEEKTKASELASESRERGREEAREDGREEAREDGSAKKRQRGRMLVKGGGGGGRENAKPCSLGARLCSTFEVKISDFFACLHSEQTVSNSSGEGL